MTPKNPKFTQNLGHGAEFPHLGIVVSTLKSCLSLRFGDNRKVFEGSPKAHGQVE